MRHTLPALPAIMLALFVSGACDDMTPTAPYPGSLDIAAIAGDRQHTEPGGTLEPLQVRITHIGTGDPVQGITVQWRIVSGFQAELVDAATTTDVAGVARASIRLGPAPGTYLVEASFKGLREQPVRFTAFAVTAATIKALKPAVAYAGDTIAIEGAGFASRAEDHAVLFDDIPAQVVGLTTSALLVVVPPCFTARATHVVVWIGTVASQPALLNVIGRTSTMVRLERGEIQTFNAAAARCLSLQAEPGSAYLVVPYNAAVTGTMPFQLGGVAGTSAAPGAGRPAAGLLAARTPAALRWETRLRLHEQALWNRIGARPAQLRFPLAARVDALAPGQERTFNVFTWEGPVRRVKAVARTLSTHAAIYQDIEAPDSGFTNEELAELARVFDDPVYGTDVATFGAASDVDANHRVLVLLTPAVNRLTLPGDSGFIAGFTYFCDLLSADDCWDSNESEILYAIVPDSTGRFGKKHRKEDVYSRLPGVLAHEFAHLIHFNQRMLVRQAPTLESLWLAEALAHSAEDTVGRVLRARGNNAAADQMLRANYARASLYLADPATTALPFERGYDSLEGRGASWLFLKYLTGRYGSSLLRDLMQATGDGTANITTAVNTSWENLVGDWFLALFGDESPELGGLFVDPRYTYPNMDLRRELASNAPGGTFPLALRTVTADFVLTGTLPASSASYVWIEPGARAQVALGLSGPRGTPLASTQARLSIWRIR